MSRWTPEYSREYMRVWRLRNPTYQRDLKAWKRIEHAKIKAEFEARKPKKVKPARQPMSEPVWYPWMNEM